MTQRGRPAGSKRCRAQVPSADCTYYPCQRWGKHLIHRATFYALTGHWLRTTLEWKS